MVRSKNVVVPEDGVWLDDVAKSEDMVLLEYVVSLRTQLSLKMWVGLKE